MDAPRDTHQIIGNDPPPWSIELYQQPAMHYLPGQLG